MRIIRLPLCSGCGESYEETIPMKSHEAGEWKTEKEPTVQETGLRVKKCVNCGTEIGTEVLEKLSHIHRYNVKRTETGCETDGKVQYTCQCGHTYQEIIKAAGHSYTETEVVNAVCGKEGYVKSTCAVCGNERIEELPALEHDFQVVQTLEPTCTEDGYIEYICSKCGEVKKEENGSAKGHTYGEWEVTQEAMLGKDGEKIRNCGECGKIETEKIDMLLTDGVDSVYYVEMSDGTQKMVIGHYDTEESDMIFELVNEMREENSLAPLARADFQDFSETRALELAVLWGHDRPNGKMFSYAENVAMAGGSHSANYAVAQYFVDNWENSSGHKANMLSPNAKYTGVAVLYNMDTRSYWETGRKSYEVYSAQNFSALTREQKNQIIHGDCEDL